MMPDPPSVRGIGEQISALANHDVIATAQVEGYDHCPYCKLWVDTTRLTQALLNRIKETDASLAQANRTVRVTKSWPGNPNRSLS